MSIFVDSRVTFPVKIRYASVYAPNGIAMGVRLLREDEQAEGATDIILDAVGRDYDTMSAIMEDATIVNHITGKPMVRSSVLCRLILLRFTKSWNVKELGTDNYIPVTSELVGRLHYNVAKALARKWLRLTGGRLESDFAD
jgi:hypothetical protein